MNLLLNPLRRLTIENFQGHKKTVIEFAPGGQLTVIIGPSRSGKTSIIRALRWLFYNQPAGVAVPDAKAKENNEETGYCRLGASIIRVTGEFESGETVIRERTRATNRYKIIRPGATEPLVLEGFGTGVPLEVQEITGIQSIKIGDMDPIMLNLSEQLDGPFLGNKSITAPGRAKILGKLAGTEEVDLAGTETGRDLYRRNQDEKRLETEIKSLGEQLQEFEWLAEMELRISRLDLLMEKLKTDRERIIRFKELKDRLARIESGMDQSREIIARWAALPQAEAAAMKVERMAERLRSMCSLQEKNALHKYNKRSCLQVINRYKILLPGLETGVAATEFAYTRRGKFQGLQVRYAQVTSGINHCNLILKKVGQIDLATAATKKAEELHTRRETLVGALTKLSSIDAQKAKLFQTVVFYDVRIPELQQQYDDELAALDICPNCGRPDICPGCGEKIEKSKLKEAI